MTQLGLGTAALGRPQYINIKSSTAKSSTLETFKKESFQVLENAYNLGIRYFDTAPGYGLAEALVLEWLKTKNDTTINVATKWGYTYTANFNANAKVHEVKEHSLQKLKEQWAYSKQLLPYLKVYQIHSATLETGVLDNKDVLQFLAKLKNKHHLKIGITTTGTNQVEVIKKALSVTINNTNLFDAYQVTYNLLDQSLLEVSKELIQQKKLIIVKEALANGRVFKNSNYKHYNKLYNYIDVLAEKYAVGADAICLNFCKQTIPSAIVLSGASSKQQLQENVKAKNFTLQTTEIETLKSFKVTPNFYWSERKQLTWQ